VKRFTTRLRNKIKRYIKNGLDISDLIKDYDIRNENLAGSIIIKFDRPYQDISGCKLARAVIGKAGEITNLCGIKMDYCNCRYTVFLGSLWLRNASARHCSVDGSRSWECHS